MPDNGVDPNDSRSERIERALQQITADLASLRAEAPASEQRIRAEAQASEQRIRAEAQASEQRILDRTQEFVRDAQTELLRGFERFSAGENILLRRLRADVTNIDASTDGRIALVEQRLTQIERRLLIDPPLGGQPAPS